MSKRLSDQDQRTLEALKDRVLLTIEFIESVQDFPSAAALRSVIETSAAKHDLRSLKLISRDIDAMTIALAPHERDGLEAILKQRLGVDKDAERAELARQVAVAIARGAVASEKERQRLEAYAEMLEATGGDPDELKAVRKLIRTG
jgi:hypothetical protein